MNTETVTNEVVTETVTETKAPKAKEGKKRGKTATFANKRAIAEFLASIKETGVTRLGSKVSYYHIRQLRQLGYLEPVQASEKKERGRYGKVFQVTGKGKSLIPLFIKAKKAAKVEAE